MVLVERFMRILADPNVAYVLLSVGVLAIAVELVEPGVGFPGVLGIICLVLASLAFVGLPLNWGGVVLIVLALVLFALDIRRMGYALSAAGAIVFALGSLFLFSPLGLSSVVAPSVRVSPGLIVLMTLAVTGLFLTVVRAGVRAQRLPTPVGAQTLLGARGTAVTALDPLGVVQVAGEQWTALAEEPPIAAGEDVQVVAQEGNKVVVRRCEAE